MREKVLTTLWQQAIILIVATKKVRCKMAGLKKGTKLTDNPKDYVLRVRLDERTLQKLDKCCEESGMNRSQVVRMGIEMQYAKTKK